MAQSSDDCCPSALPPVTTTAYLPRGHYIQVADYNTYITGPSPAPATAGIIFIYDVFGFLPQTLQGADRLAASLSCLVLVPDILNGQYAEEKWLAPTASRAEQDAAAKYRAALAVPTFVSRVMAVARDAKNKFPHVARWGAFGLCWGGKVVAAASRKDTPFVVSGQAHPARPTKEDALALTIPHLMLASPEDNKYKGIDHYAEVLKKLGYAGEVETYERMFHGWMGGRAKLEDKENAEEFERGYYHVAVFFAKYLMTKAKPLSEKLERL